MDKLKEFLDKNNTDYDIGIINYGRYHKLPVPFENEQVIRFKWKKDSIEKLTKKLKNIGIRLIFESSNKYSCLYKIEGSNNKIYVVYAVDSHVQLPECLLKNFRTDERLYYIDTSKNNKIVKSSARNYNTEFGYYSLFFEDYLSNGYEKIISELIIKINSFINQEVKEIILDNLNKKINKLFKMAIFRNPKFVKQINEESVFAQLFDGGYDSEYLLTTEEEIDSNYIKDYVPVLFVNKTKKGILLTKSLISGIQVQKNNFLIMPLHPKFAIALVTKRYYEDMIKELGEGSYIQIDEDSALAKLNFQIYLNAKEDNNDLIGQKNDLVDLLEFLTIK